MDSSSYGLLFAVRVLFRSPRLKAILKTQKQRDRAKARPRSGGREKDGRAYSSHCITRCSLGKTRKKKYYVDIVKRISRLRDLITTK